MPVAYKYKAWSLTTRVWCWVACLAPMSATRKRVGRQDAYDEVFCFWGTNNAYTSIRVDTVTQYTLSVLWPLTLFFRVIAHRFSVCTLFDPLKAWLYLIRTVMGKKCRNIRTITALATRSSRRCPSATNGRRWTTRAQAAWGYSHPNTPQTDHRFPTSWCRSFKADLFPMI